MNTSTDSANTAHTILTTLTDKDDSSFDGDEKIRITTNLLEHALHKTPSSTDKEEEFYSASSNDEPTPKSNEDLTKFFQKQDIMLEEYDDSTEPLLQHSTVPRSEQSSYTVEDSKLPLTGDDDTSKEWYNIKIRQPKLDPNQKKILQTKRKLKLLSKKYSRCYFEEERVRVDKGRNSSGFAAEQMTIDSEDSFQWESNSFASPPNPASPTGSITPTEEKPAVTFASPTKSKHFTFPPMTEANDLLNEYKMKDRHRRQSQASKEVESSQRSRNRVASSTTSHNPIKNRPSTRDVATIVVQQPSVSGNSPEQHDREMVSNVRRVSSAYSESVFTKSHGVKKESSMRQMLDVTTSIQWQENDSKCGAIHHNRSQSVRTPGSKSNVQVNGTSRYRPNYLCLPQQRTRVASMPNTGVEEEYYRLRQFSISGKNIINRGDSVKSRRSRSNTSIASSNSSHSTEQVTVCGTTGTVAPGGCSSVAGTASGAPSLPSSRESSCASCPGINPPYRVIMLGSSGVGKSSLVSQFMTSEFLQASGISIDEDFGEKSVCVSLDGEESEIIFVDQPNSRTSPVDLSNYESPNGYCVVYSTSDRESFQRAELYLQALWKIDSIRSKAVILVGNKTDLVRIRAVSTEEGSRMATSYDCKFIETSVGINHNVDELLVGILTQIRLKLDNPPDPSLPRDQTKKRSRSPMTQCGPRIYRGSRTSASLRVRKIINIVLSINTPRSKSCEDLHSL